MNDELQRSLVELENLSKSLESKVSWLIEDRNEWKRRAEQAEAKLQSVSREKPGEASSGPSS